MFWKNSLEHVKKLSQEKICSREEKEMIDIMSLEIFKQAKDFHYDFNKSKTYLKFYKNEKYYKNHFGKEVSNNNSGIICNFCGKGCYISKSCLLRKYSYITHYYHIRIIFI